MAYMNDEELNKIYDEVYKNGKEYFHSTNFEILYSEVYKIMKRDLENKKVLDLGCGDGSFINKYINLEDPKEIVGIDYSEEGIKKAKEEIENSEYINIYKKDAEFIHMNFNKLRKKIDNGTFIKANYFDIITSIGVIEHLDNPELIFTLANDLLVPGGLFILEHPNFINIRGIIWKTLEIFLGAKMSKTDKHTLLPNKIFSLMENNNFECIKIKTFNYDVGMYGKMLDDFSIRLRKALTNKVDNLDDKIKEFFDYLRIITNDKFFNASPANGSEIIWKMRKKV